MNTTAVLVALSIFLSSFNLSSSNKTETKWVTNSKGARLHKEEEKQYNSKGDIIKWVQYLDNAKEICQTYTCKYSGDHKSERIRTFCNGKGDELTTYTYDWLGRLVQEEDYDAKHHLKERRVNSYKGNTSQKTHQESFEANENEAYTKTTYEYYPDGLLKREVQTAGGSWFGTTEYKYDGSKHLIYTAAQVDGGVGWVKTSYIYQNGILIKDIVKVPDTGTEYHSYVTTKQ